MAVAIRLRRDGAKNKPYYRIVVADKHSPRDGKFLELIGTYDPKKNNAKNIGENSGIKIDRADYWIGQGAQPSDTVNSILKKERVKKQKAEIEKAKEAERAAVEAVKEAARAKAAAALADAARAKIAEAAAASPK